jgi:NAD(P)-dependent dehydrogenase (short-subunit alcohol dehydrogenase family)
MRTAESDRLSSPAGNRGEPLTPISPRANLDRSKRRFDAAELGGQPYLSPYVAAKAGLAGTTRNAAHAHRWDRIRINGLDIGWTDSEGEDATQRTFHGADDDWRAKAAASVPMGTLGQVDEIADFVVFLLSDRSGVVTGSVIDWDQAVVGGSN